MSKKNKTEISEAIQERRETLKKASKGVRKNIRNVDYGANLWKANDEGSQYAFFRDDEDQAKARLDDVEDMLDNILTDEEVQEIKNQLQACRNLISEEDDQSDDFTLEEVTMEESSHPDNFKKHTVSFSAKLKQEDAERSKLWEEKAEEDKEDK